MSANLYVDSRGRPITRFSYSAGGDFHFCQKFFYHRRIAGWRDREQRGSLEFGKAIESAVQFHHSNNFEGAADYFTKLWDVHKTNTELTYTQTEGSWEELALSGRELIQLYAIQLPKLPIAYEPAPRFQIKYSKEVFPGTELAGIEFVAYVDMLAFDRIPDGTVRTPSMERRKQLIDIKTSGVMLPETPGILALDQQLRTYAWVTGISNVGFLNFVKTNRSIKAGMEVTLLQDIGDLKAGRRVIVAANNTDEEVQPLFDSLPVTVLDGEAQYDEMKKAIGDKPASKAGKENKINFLARVGKQVSAASITKQRIQFLTACIDQEAQEEVATQVGADIAQIVHSSKNNQFFKQGGIRFPNNICSNCSCLGLCLKDDRLRDERLKRDDSEDVFGDED